MADDVATAFRHAEGPMQTILVNCLDFMNGLPFFRAYKSRSWGALRIAPGEKVLDVCCGVGFDVAEMAVAHRKASFVGADRAPGFLEIARERTAALSNVSFIEAEADRLPLADASIDAARIDRSLQHIADPAAVLREMARVTRRGGRIVAVEPDWGTFFVHNGDAETGATLAAKWRESFRHPDIGRRLPQLFADAGVAEICWRADVLALADVESANVVFDLSRLLQDCVEAGLLAAGAADDWRRAAQEATRRGTFLACLTLIQCEGVVPD